jgi:hypothetical protein
MEKKSKAGRPPLYKKEFAQQAYELCLLGLTDDEMARVFGVDARTINRWKVDHPEFCQSIKDGKDVADAKVASRLFKRAMGYEHQAVKIVADAKTKEEHIVEYTERYPPDTAAAIFWLKNRQKAKWRDKTEQDVQATIDAKVDVALSPADAYMKMLGK